MTSTAQLSSSNGVAKGEDLEGISQSNLLEDPTDDLEVQLLCQAFSRVCCINLRRRPDRWSVLMERTQAILGEPRARAFLQSIERFDAVDGAALFGHQTPSSSSTVDDLLCRLEWDATNNAKHDRHIRPPMIKRMTPGEVGCALSHVRLWQALAQSEVDSTMLLLEDDVVFYPGKPASAAQQPQQKAQPPGFLEVFASLWKILPSDWDILYLGFCNFGKRIPVASCSTTVTNDEGSVQVQVQLFRPTYGFYTHAYAISKSAASKLVSHLPVAAPLDVWLADNDWFGLNVYCGAVIHHNRTAAKDGLIGLKGKGVSLIAQRRVDSDIVHSAHHV